MLTSNSVDDIWSVGYENLREGTLHQFPQDYQQYSSDRGGIQPAAVIVTAEVLKIRKYVIAQLVAGSATTAYTVSIKSLWWRSIYQCPRLPMTGRVDFRLFLDAAQHVW